MNDKTDIEEVERMISKKIDNFVSTYNKYPKFLKIPLWVSNCMKQKMRDMEHFNLDYNTELLLYRDLTVCETIAITQLEEIEVF